MQRKHNVSGGVNAPNDRSSRVLDPAHRSSGHRSVERAVPEHGALGHRPAKGVNGSEFAKAP
ncbi:hypothetical protein STENM223S_09282 [Streptomyces tendae]